MSSDNDANEADFRARGEHADATFLAWEPAYRAADAASRPALLAQINAALAQHGYVARALAGATVILGPT